MGWICLTFAIVLSTALWPVARWTLYGDGNPRVMGFWISLTAAAVSLAVLIVRGVPPPAPAIWVAGGIFAVAYAVGFIILIMRCLQIGPSGPTVTINNSAMIFGVLYGLLWLDPHTPNICILAGAVGVFAALAMIGVGGRPDPSGAHPVGREWLPLVLLGGVFSGVSFMVQTHVGLRHPGLGDGLWLVGLGFGQSAVILLLSVARDSRILWRRRRERLGGMVLGVSNAVGLPLTLLAFRHLGSEIVLPVSVTTPMVLVMVLGSVLYKERLTRLTWAGCLLAAFSVGLIGYGSARNEHSARGPHLPRAAAPSGMTHAQHRERARPEKKGSGTRAQWTRLRPDGIERLVLFRTTTDPRGASADRPESVVELNGVCR